MKRLIVLALFLVISVTSAASFAAELREAKINKKVVLECLRGAGSGEIGKLTSESEPTTIVLPLNPIAVDKSGSVYVADSINRRIEKFDSNGHYQAEYKITDTSLTSIDAVFAGPNSDVYALTNNELLIHFLPDGKVKSVVDMKQFAILERDPKGKIISEKRRGFAFDKHKVFVDMSGKVFVLAGDLFILSEAGEIIKRWGTKILGFIVDPQGILTIGFSDSYAQYDRKLNLLNMGQLYDKGKLIGKQWGLITRPEQVDAVSCVYGFTESKDGFLGKYCERQLTLYKLPLKRDDLVNEHWTVDQLGNIYTTHSHDEKFRVEKFSISNQPPDN